MYRCNTTCGCPDPSPGGMACKCSSKATIGALLRNTAAVAPAPAAGLKSPEPARRFVHLRRMT
ncbi:hypothetical protein Patl1_35738 [Pistacia atlantica]|nr:hypothetical protein Patl1_35738 [Pistacia atlantica]